MTMFTVIIPTFNHAEFLRRAIGSVINQSFSDWECLIIDNHSTDHTEEVVASFSDSRLRLLKIHNNGVIAASRNLGVENAQGEWLAFLDSDDFWYSSKLKVVSVEIAQNSQADVISTDELIVSNKSDKKVVLRYGPFCKDFYRILLMEGNRLSTSATVVRKSFLVDKKLRFREDCELVTVEDYDLWLRLAYEKADFAFVHSVEGEYLIHGGNSSANLARHYKNLNFMLHDHVFKVQNFTENNEKIWRLVSARVLLAEAVSVLKTGQWRRAFFLLLRAFYRAPLWLIRHVWTRLSRHRDLELV
ncbi:glycosyltransferase [Chromobacterium haemolyticum]|uniref:Glycosyltransferase n=1 Tax=Chromobacterium fluminis TaxID=3044269 RepID=A0ABX0LEU7_9NEIS|nr:glycosyltransferase [Chromobacterium haemolyticum]NHR06915.1 glycosyltransferase [Chromobacterium haemolyticum]